MWSLLIWFVMYLGIPGEIPGLTETSWGWDLDDQIGYHQTIAIFELCCGIL